MNAQIAEQQPRADRLRHIAAEARRLEDSAAADPDPGSSGLRAADLPIVLYGAGPLGRMTLAHLRQIGLIPAAVVDGDQRRWGSSLDGVVIVSPDEAVRRFAACARFVVTIYNGSAVRLRLAERGCVHVAHFSELFFEHAAEFLPFCGLAPRSTVLDAWPEVESAAGAWSDERSVAEYAAQLAWRLRLADRALPPHDAPRQCYFPESLYSYLDDEVLFDCGAFDGDSIRQYLARRPAGGRSTVLAFEPDAASFARLDGYVSGLSPGPGTSIRIEPWAVAQTSGAVRFSALGSVTSGVRESGGISVEAVALDDLDVAPTLIKMDVEGFELPALRGAAALLRRHRPVLAISLYHHASDLWTIPNYLKSLVPDYHLFLRRYAEDCWELVLYAVPAPRMLAVPVAPTPDAVTP